MRFRIALLIIGLSLLAACNKTGTPAPTQPAQPTAAPVQPTAAPVVPTTAPTQAPVPGVLPHSLYYIGPSTTVNQIWRLNIDGTTQAQITHEPAEVTNFDVSPVDGSIVLISANKLIKVDANGSNRTELFSGPAINPPPGTDQLNTQVSNVRWKPDGSQIAFGLNGVNLMAANGGAPIVVQASDPIPTTPNPNVAPKFYWPIAWSPDGSRILMSIAFYPEGGSLAVKTIGGGAPTMLNNPEGWPCCNPNWSLDGGSVFLSNDYPGLISAGLWNINATTGQGTTLIAGSDAAGTTFTLVSHAQQLSDQRLYYFMAQANAFPDKQPAVSMTSSAVDGNTDRKQLRVDSYVVGEALWDPHHSGAVIKDLTGQPLDYTGSAATQLVWLNMNNTVPVKLPGYGYNLRWGKP
jgi:hypothetical protein